MNTDLEPIPAPAFRFCWRYRSNVAGQPTRGLGHVFADTQNEADALAAQKWPDQRPILDCAFSNEFGGTNK